MNTETSTSSLIFAKQLDEAGGCTAFKSLAEVPRNAKPLWLHFDANQSNARNEMQDAFPDMDEHTLNALFDIDARPRVLKLETGVLIILRGINHNEGAEPEDMIGVRLWVTNSRIISLRYRKSKALMTVSESLDTKTGPKNIGEIVTQISQLLIRFIEASVNQLDEQLDELESQVLEDPGRSLRHDISEVRITAVLLRRYVAPQREALTQLRLVEMEWMAGKINRRLQEIQDGMIRTIENLDSVRERSQVIMDELASALSEKLNRNLYVLSVITAIFLPLGFLTGLFGINIGGMPGVENQAAFFNFTIILGVLVAIQIVLFKIFKWF